MESRVLAPEPSAPAPKRELPALLASQPAPAMPDNVAARITEALAAESASRLQSSRPWQR